MRIAVNPVAQIIRLCIKFHLVSGLDRSTVAVCFDELVWVEQLTAL